MVTVVPGGPLEGTNEVINGKVGNTWNEPELNPLRPAAVTVITPVVAPVGTVAIIMVSP